MTAKFSIVVDGDPQPQGSKKHVGGGRMVESAKGLGAWRKNVREAAVLAMADRHWLDGPLYLSVNFFIKRPKYHYGRHGLKPTAPTWCVKTPDTDKLVRAVGDALTGVVYPDDSQIACFFARKFYADDRPGAAITVSELEGYEQ